MDIAGLHVSVSSTKVDPKCSPINCDPQTRKDHDEKNQRVEVVAATSMVKLDQVTGHGCALHEVRHIKCVASKTTESVCQSKGEERRGAICCIEDEEAAMDTLIGHVIFDPVMDTYK